ncbi:MAG: SusD/RagB family nutrient-binding outer membrane lipoprotein [Tannerella sp.]|jgi:hypothetical protein|nr:SusD/RagB family nutrient-binding outer membrane lipoprotein [Tannerella sp.]
MRNFKYIILGSILALGFSSCTDWLNVNTDPDNPNNKSVLVQNRLPWIQRFYQYSAGTANFRTSCMAGVFYSNSAVNAFTTTWAANNAASSATTSYQTWFVGTAANLNDLYEVAEEQGAYHYMAAANVFHALGFMQMLDLYGEMPYTEALAGIAAPAYDDGKTIFNGCIAKLDEAIELFGRTQEATAPGFAGGDMWNGGDVGKWIKLCYGLKARYLLKLSKKSDLYSAADILDCLSKGPQSNADNIVATCFNSATDVTDYLIGDPIMTNGNWNYAAYGSNQRISQYYYNLLTNMRGSGVEDPRMSKIVPAAMYNVKFDLNGKVQSNDWLRSKGVDSYGQATRLLKGGATSIQITSYASKDVDLAYYIADPTDRAAFISAQEESGRPYSVNGDSVKVTYRAGSIYVNNNNYLYAGDTVYVNIRSNASLTGTTGTSTRQNESDVNWYLQSADAYNAGVAGSTGSFQLHPMSDMEILTYHEMCFIKAEVYMRQGDRGNALTAYKAGIQAHLDMMQAKLTEWHAFGYDAANPDMSPMDAGQISAYMGSNAVCQDAGSLTMSDIMLQKYLAMGCSLENWNDMRRLNFSAGNISDFGVVYPGYDRGPLFTGQAALPGTAKTDPAYWLRRWTLPTALELGYNSAQATAMNIHAGELFIWSIPVWWDCASDDEYYSYIK